MNQESANLQFHSSSFKFIHSNPSFCHSIRHPFAYMAGTFSYSKIWIGLNISSSVSLFTGLHPFHQTFVPLAARIAITVPASPFLATVLTMSCTLTCYFSHLLHFCFERSVKHFGPLNVPSSSNFVPLSSSQTPILVSCNTPSDAFSASCSHSRQCTALVALAQIIFFMRRRVGTVKVDMHAATWVERNTCDCRISKGTVIQSLGEDNTRCPSCRSRSRTV